MSIRRRNFRPIGRRRAGVTLIECMVLLVIMSIICLGTGVALQSLIKIPTANNRALVITNLMTDKMEKLRALDFPTLAATASSSDTVAIDNVTYTRTWTITLNPGNTYDNNFLQVKVAIGNQSLTSAVCKP